MQIPYAEWHAQLCSVYNPCIANASVDTHERVLFGLYREGKTPAEAISTLRAGVKIPCQFQEAAPVATVSIYERKRVVRAYPGGDPMIEGLCAQLTKCVNAPYYCSLSNTEAGSGFYPEARTLAEAKEEVRAHMRKYPTWDTARLYDSHGGEKGELRATFKNRKAAR